MNLTTKTQRAQKKRFLQGNTIYLHQSERSSADAASKIIDLCERFQIEAIAVGNGTAGRETESFIRSLKLSRKVPVVMVNESGASVYSASEAAREEFPDHDVTVRGSVSIGRRLMDPMAELVKIDPKSIGVGQYQHDVDQGALKKSLDDVVKVQQKVTATVLDVDLKRRRISLSLKNNPGKKQPPQAGAV
ncbi:MAG: hypothetical protein NUV74_03830 [Candidatus Brocadiaceae bacterium]|nr:hypothetical protein [Candidatus Brocadiaceae bacterium]